MDAIDREILVLLQRDGRLSHEEIAKQVHLSRPAVHERVRRMEEQGILRGYQALIDWSALDLPLTAFIWVRARTVDTSCNQTSALIMRQGCDEARIEECHRVTGEWCMLLKARVASPLALQNLLDRIRALASVEATKTTLVLSTVCEQEDACKYTSHAREKKHDHTKEARPSAL
jgi:Lrp/AsnC family transcriptional regulator, leucine-responsive regulatory protein